MTLAATALGVVPPATQGPAPEAWKLVPAGPPTCFADDGFDKKVQEAEQAAIAGKDRQRELNETIQKQFDDMPMMEKAQRMQAWMLKNPDAASKMLEASADADGAVAAVEELQATAERIDQELDAQKKAFSATIDQALTPLLAKEDAWVKSKAVVVGEAQEYVFTTAADHAAYVAIVNEQNAAHEKACAPFFGANGSFPKLLGQLRTEVTEKALAFDARGTAMKTQQMAIMETPGGGYRSSGQYDIVRTYLRTMYDVTRQRRYKATPKIRLMVREHR
jgi:hypothetical protein